MITEVKDYITERLKAAMGAGTVVFYTQKELTACTESHVGAVLLEHETLEHHNCKADRSKSIKLYSRAVQFSVVLGEYSMSELEPMYCSFLAILGDRLSLAGGRVATIEVGAVEWTAQDDGILRAKIAALVPVTVTGGIYMDNPLATISNINTTILQEG